jgi:hypothetical protein
MLALPTKRQNRPMGLTRQAFRYERSTVIPCEWSQFWNDGESSFVAQNVAATAGKISAFNA